MTPFIQTKTTEKGQRGNCLATCLGCLLDLPVSRIPEFEEMGRNEWRTSLNEWLNSIGYKMESVVTAPVGFAIAVGWRKDKVLHAVIVKDGEFFHDPNPSGEFFTKHRNYWQLTSL